MKHKIEIWLQFFKVSETWQEKGKKMSTGLVAAAAATKVAYGNGWDGCGHVWSELL